MRTILNKDITAGAITLAFSCSLVLGIAACAASSDDDKKKGGDHIPEDTPRFVSSGEFPVVPSGAKIDREESDAAFLRKAIHVSERYAVCVDPDEVSAASFAKIEERLKESGGDLAQRGLEGVLNYALEHLQSFRPNIGAFSSRIAIDLVYLDEEARCSFAIFRRGSDAFPFTVRDFKSKNTAFLYAGRIIDSDDTSRATEVGVGYVRDTLSDDRLAIAAEYLVASFLGLGESPAENSVLNDNIAVQAAWQLDSKNADDYQIIFGFALAYTGVLKPTDLETFHFYADTLGFTTPPTDPLLHIPADSAAAPFFTAQGRNDVTGARLPNSTLKICVAKDSAEAPSDAAILDALGLFSSGKAGSLGAMLKAVRPTFDVQVALVAEGIACELFVAFRSTDQYPFADGSFNGLYAHEGKVLDATGDPAAISVIYLNMDNLSATETPEAGKKWFGWVLEHEAGHFMGLKHSHSTRSILSPTGYNTSYDLAGGDQAMFDAWAEVAAKAD